MILKFVKTTCQPELILIVRHKSNYYLCNFLFLSSMVCLRKRRKILVFIGRVWVIFNIKNLFEVFIAATEAIAEKLYGRVLDHVNCLDLPVKVCFWFWRWFRKICSLYLQVGISIQSLSPKLFVNLLQAVRKEGRWKLHLFWQWIDRGHFTSSLQNICIIFWNAV